MGSALGSRATAHNEVSDADRAEATERKGTFTQGKSSLTAKLEVRYESPMAPEISQENEQSSHSPDPRMMVRRLIGAGEKLQVILREAILSVGSAAVPFLIEILQDEDLHASEDPGGGWAPIHAVGLLGELHATEAIEPMLEVLADSSLDDIINSKIVFALEAMGKPALEPALAAYAANTDPDFRGALICVLAGLKIKDERIFNILLDELARGEGIAPGLLAEYGDPSALPALIRAFDEFKIDPNPDHPLANQDIVELQSAIEDLGGTLTDFQQAKFDRAMKAANEWRAHRNSIEEEQSGLPSRPVGTSRSKIGRNDPCHCGSGKKYKKCCLANDEDAARSRSARIDETLAEIAEAKARGQGPAQQMVQFAQPLIDASNGDLESVNKAMSLGMLFWNLAVCRDDQQREELLADAIKNAMKLDKDQDEFRLLAKDMIERHHQMFPEMHR